MILITSNIIRTVHNDLSLDVIQRNIEIQEHLFQLISFNIKRLYIINLLNLLRSLLWNN